MPRTILFCDAAGRIVEVQADAPPNWNPAPGTPLWEALLLDESATRTMLSLSINPQRQTITDPDGLPMTMASCRLPLQLAPQGGYMVILTGIDLAPTELNRAQSLNYAFFNAVFNDARDAILLTDEDLRILEANRKAHTLYASGGESLRGQNVRGILREENQARTLASIRSLNNGRSWRAQLATRSADGREAPVRLNVRCLNVDGVRLYQFMIRDLRGRMALERNLAQTRLQVADMNTALKQVLRNVEEERQELKDELALQVREEVLPTVERIVQEESQLVRQAYRSALEEKITDIVETSQDSSSLTTQLTPREMDICRLIQQSWQGRAIAEELGISFETLQSHRKNIRRKLGLRGASQALSTFLQQHAPL